jgi:polyhydroxyalkanoate synthase
MAAIDPTEPARSIASAWQAALGALTGADQVRPDPALMPTARDVVLRDGTAELLHFRRADGAAPSVTTPVLLVPSLINRWYVLDLRPGASVAGALVEAGLDVWCLDWGTPEDEDRYRSWDDVLARLARMVRRVRRETGASRVGLLGYCMGGTLSAIYTAQHPDEIAALVNLAGPIDFARGGMLARMVDSSWFDAGAVADAGNVAPTQMQAGFTALRPTIDLAKWASMPDTMSNRTAWEGMRALEIWASDNIPFPGEAYRTYIGELYQGNRLLAGTHRPGGRPARLGDITCPTMIITADRDNICPAAAANALADHVGSAVVKLLSVPGGHVGAVVGSRAAREMYPALATWLSQQLDAAGAHVAPTAQPH